MSDINETLAEWEAKTDAATEGPWVATDPHPFLPGAQIRLYGRKFKPIYIEANSERHVRPTDDAEFIVVARTAMPALLSAVENVLALCERADASDGRGMAAIYTDSVRKAIAAALNGEQA